MPKDSEITASQQTALVSFRDRAFWTRTVVFSDGDTVMVEKSLITVSDPEHVTFLDQHADFERVDGSA